MTVVVPGIIVGVCPFTAVVLRQSALSVRVMVPVIVRASPCEFSLLFSPFLTLLFIGVLIVFFNILLVIVIFTLFYFFFAVEAHFAL